MIEIKLPRCLVVLTEEEMLSLLKANPVVWERGLRRGKHFRRAAANERREVNFNADGIKNYAGRRSVNRNCLRR